MKALSAPPRCEMTLYGRAEFFLTKQMSVWRGELGSRLELAINDLPSASKREKLTGVLDALNTIEDLSPLPLALKMLLDEVHSGISAISLSERHQGLLRASKLLIENDALRVATKACFNPPDEIVDYDDAVQLCRLQLNLAVQRLSDVIRWAHPRKHVGTQLVASEISTAHQWIIQAGDLF